MSLQTIGIKYVLPVLQKVAPGFTDKLKVNIAVGAEKAHRPHPFSLFTGMAMGKPDDGDTAPTAKPLAPSAPSAPHNLMPARLPFAPSGYVSWPGLADRRYTGRHLPPADPA